MAKVAMRRPKTGSRLPSVGKRSELILDALDRSLAVIEFAADGTIISANQNYLDLMGYEADELIGKHHSIFVDPAEAQSVEYERFWQSLRLGTFQSAEFRRLDKHGNEVWIQATYNPVISQRGTVTSIIKFATDVTDAKLKAIDHEGQLAALGRSLAVVEFSRDGVILNANTNFLRMMGYRLDELLGQHHSMLVGGEEAGSSEYKRFWTGLQSGAYQAAEFRRVTKDGHEIWLQATYNPIVSPTGRVLKIVKFATDVTARKHAEQQLASQHAELEVQAKVLEVLHRDAELARAKAEAANLAKAHFLANMSHELRTPLNAILGFSELMTSGFGGPISDRHLSYAAEIHVAGRHLLDMVNQILDLARIEEGAMRLQRTECAPHALARECLSMLTSVAAQKGVELRFSGEDVGVVLLDVVRMKQVFINLIGNAVKFTPPDGLIELRLDRTDTQLLIEVEDNGCGMTPGEIEGALTPFRQRASVTRRPEQGAGLGLPIAKSIVEAHGGYLGIRSEEDVGTTIRIELPIIRP
jgi:PAS domain S-box-containing protein